MRRSRRAATGFLRDFQEFALKGNVVDLAIAVVIGGAFGKIITAFVEDLIMPLLNPIVSRAGGDWRSIVVGPGLKIGDFLGAIVDFLLIALVLFLVIRLFSRFKRQEEAAPPAPTERECPYCLEKVPLAATRCRACTSELPPPEPSPYP